MHSQPNPQVTQVHQPSPAKVGIYARDPQRIHYDGDCGRVRHDLRMYHGMDPNFTLRYFYPQMVHNSRLPHYSQNELIHQ